MSSDYRLPFETKIKELNKQVAEIQPKYIRLIKEEITKICDKHSWDFWMDRFVWHIYNRGTTENAINAVNDVRIYELISIYNDIFTEQMSPCKYVNGEWS